MPGWNIKYSYGEGIVDVRLSSRPVVGTPLVSVVIADSLGVNTLPCGVFRFTMASETSVLIEAVSAFDVKNPALFTNTMTVIADGVTENLNLLPGVAVILSDNAVAGDQFEIGVGCYWDSATLAWVHALPLDIAVSGNVGASRLLHAKNDSGTTQCNCQAVVTNAMWITNAQSPSRPFLSFEQTGLLSPAAHDDLAGKAVTFDDLVDGLPNTVSILVDGASIDVYDVSNDETIAGGAGLKCDGYTVYRFADSTDYQSGQFVLSADLEESDTAIVYVSDGGDFIEISDMFNDFVIGSSAVYLTQNGAPEGVVQDGESVTFAVRVNAPSDASVDLNQRLFSLRILSVSV